MSSLGAPVFFAQFLAASCSFAALVADTPLGYKSNRAHQPRDVSGTLVLGLRFGHYCYLHLESLRGNDLAPRLLGLSAIVSVDCARRALVRVGEGESWDWLRGHIDQTCNDFLDTKWVLDIDVTIKTIRGPQEGASLGRNPHTPGRPSHPYRRYWIATLRLCIAVGAHPGNQHHQPITQYHHINLLRLSLAVFQKNASGQGVELSRQAFAELVFVFVPIDEGFFAFGDALFAFAENFGVPCGGLEAFGVAGQIRPDGFHGAKLFRRGHLVEWEGGFLRRHLFSDGPRARRKDVPDKAEAAG